MSNTTIYIALITRTIRTTRQAIRKLETNEITSNIKGGEVRLY